jgi:hypothetical protein
LGSIRSWRSIRAGRPSPTFVACRLSRASLASPGSTGRSAGGRPARRRASSAACRPPAWPFEDPHPGPSTDRVPLRARSRRTQGWNIQTGGTDGSRAAAPAGDQACLTTIRSMMLATLRRRRRSRGCRSSST